MIMSIITKISLSIISLLFMPLQTNENIGMGTLEDKRDGKTYKTIKVGKIEWMAENLAYKDEEGDYWSVENKRSNIKKYGYLYNWNTACEACPDGWRLPETEDWNILIDKYGGKELAATKLKSENFSTEKNLNNNSSGFSAMGAGFKSPNRDKRYDPYRGVGNYAYFWTNEHDAGSARYVRMNKADKDIKLGTYHRGFAMAVRCVRDLE